MPELVALGRLLLIGGIALALLGGLLLLVGRLGLPRLPGDLVFQRDGVVIWIPLATSLILSLVLTLVLNLLARR